MTALSANALSERLANPADRFTITPILDWGRQVADGSVDIRLDKNFVVTLRSRFASLDPFRFAGTGKGPLQFQERVSITGGESFVLHPNELVLGSSLEYLSFPLDLMSYVIGRSSWGRLGLIIATATQINPGFQGNLTLELVNAGNVPLRLFRGVRIAQLVVHRVEPGEVHGYKSKYSLQIGPGLSKVHEDPELQFLRFPRRLSIVGITGHKGSGKHIVLRHLTDDYGYRYFSLSHVVREEFRRFHHKTGTRDQLREFGNELRQQHSGDFLAREMLRRLQKLDELGIDTKIVVDGIRNRHEIELFSKLPNFRLVAVRASREKIMENLRSQGLLVDEVIFQDLERRSKDKDIPEQDRQSFQEMLEVRMNQVGFEQRYELDKGGADPLGQDVDLVVALLSPHVRHNPLAQIT